MRMICSKAAWTSSSMWPYKRKGIYNMILTLSVCTHSPTYLIQIHVLLFWLKDETTCFNSTGLTSFTFMSCFPYHFMLTVMRSFFVLLPFPVCHTTFTYAFRLHETRAMLQLLLQLPFAPLHQAARYFSRLTAAATMMAELYESLITCVNGC